jgi:amidophosphoribosyltransferase
VKNTYVSRLVFDLDDPLSSLPYSLISTFIMPRQDKREANIRQKLTPIKSAFAGKSILIIDDSIVRGTTAKAIVNMVHECLPTAIYFAVSSPPVVGTNQYGIAVPSTELLVAHGRSTEDVANFLGVNALCYLPLDQLKASIPICDSCCFEDSLFISRSTK